MLVKIYNNYTFKVAFSFRIIKTEKFLKDCPNDGKTYTLCRKIDQFGKHGNKLVQIICVVYFDQRSGALHSKHWSKYASLKFFVLKS